MCSAHLSKINSVGTLNVVTESEAEIRQKHKHGTYAISAIVVREHNDA